MIIRIIKEPTTEENPWPESQQVIIHHSLNDGGMVQTIYNTNNVIQLFLNGKYYEIDLSNAEPIKRRPINDTPGTRN